MILPPPWAGEREPTQPAGDSPRAQATAALHCCCTAAAVCCAAAASSSSACRHEFRRFGWRCKHALQHALHASGCDAPALKRRASASAGVPGASRRRNHSRADYRSARHRLAGITHDRRTASESHAACSHARTEPVQRLARRHLRDGRRISSLAPRSTLL